jgi:ribonuclease HII
MTSTKIQPNMRVERGLLRAGHRLLAAVDEVGRGASAGMCSVGVVLIDASVGRMPAGVRDSKLLTAAAREDLVPKIKKWVVGSAVGHASAQDVDELGIIAALRLAAHRALLELGDAPHVILLDGDHDWLSPPKQLGLFTQNLTEIQELAPVITKVKADLQCASVAAASVLAKVERDALMQRLAQEHPQYGFERNMGYLTASHRAALLEWGVCAQHRLSWVRDVLASAVPSDQPS